MTIQIVCAPATFAEWVQKNCGELAKMGFNNIQHGKTRKERLNYIEFGSIDVVNLRFMIFLGMHFWIPTMWD